MTQVGFAKLTELPLRDAWKEAASSRDIHSDTRLGLRTHYATNYPEAAASGIRPQRDWNANFPFFEGEVRLSLWIGEKNCGIFVGGKRGDKYSARDTLKGSADEPATKLNSDWFGKNASGHIFGEREALSYHDPMNWPQICDWMEVRRGSYSDALLYAEEALS